MLPSIESLRCFTAAAKLLNFRAAARSVALTPAAFGQRIKQLEEQLGAPLFQRTTRSVRLTESGLALLPAAERCLLAAAECVRVGAAGNRSLAPLDVTIGTRHELGLSWILPQLDGLTKAQPWLRLHLYFGSGADILLRVRSMEVECCVTSSRLVDPKLDSLRLHREDYVFVGATALLDKKPLERPKDAREHTLLDTDETLALFRYFRDAPGGGDHLQFAGSMRLGTIEAIRQRVLHQAGVAVLPEYLVRKDLASGKITRILPNVELIHDYFRLVFRSDDPRRPIYEQMAKQMAATPLR
ncbi:MAG: LysR family transcriptional regulator [Deltaproteobacteria bacterium]|nr:LysR family transcriptional regulator [Deltaproteobacteria bacterium]